ncbi:MAG: glycosyltransferase [Acidimicrobiales bacterium]
MTGGRRFLFVFPPFAGHVNPAAGVAAELRRRGHEVAWVLHQELVGSLVGDGCDGYDGADQGAGSPTPTARIYPAGNRFVEQVAEHLGDRNRVKGLTALRFLWERVLVPLATDMVDPVRAAVDDYRPDVVVADQQTFAGGLVAVERGLPWATSACSTAELVDALGLVPKVAEWMHGQLERLYVQVGLPWLVTTGFDPRFSPDLVIEYSSRELVGEVGRHLGAVEFVGPVAPPRRAPTEAAPFPWRWLDRYRDNVFVSLGTLSNGIGDRFLRMVLDAVDGRPYGVVMVAPAALAAELMPPANVLVMPFVPQYDLLPRMQAVLCHGGHNTTVGALGLGVPVVCAPIRDDQPVTASQVVQAGAGLRLKFSRCSASDVATALDTVLGDPSYRRAAARIARSFEAAGGAPRAADRLEAVAGAPGR